MRLRNVRPPLPAELLSQLEDIGVKSDADLLFGYGDAVDIYCKLTSEGITLQDVKTAIAQVTLHCSCTPNTGSKELALHEEKHKKRIQVDLMSGVPELDGLVSGFGQFSVLELSGDSGSGKTALAQQIVFRHLSREPSMTSLWIDTTGGFSIDNISPNILESSDNRDLADVLERLQVSVAFDLTAVHEALDTLRSAYTVCRHLPSLTLPLIHARSG
ncbi:hypothetical protein K474DRAFT_1667164 [Panus rudis PR-1116 ss-1]|nr:hypothetical protein K474DRAFT_1667164 [Panus rudis PR-1116 ss-1]